MNEQPFLRITEEDVAEANRLSLGCPICASPVERSADRAELSPVICSQCETLYHQACWERNGGKCAMLGCGHSNCRPYGQEVGPRLTIRKSDLPREAPRHSPNGRTKQLKMEQKREVERLRRSSFWQRVWKWLLDQIKIDYGPPSGR